LHAAGASWRACRTADRVIDGLISGLNTTTIISQLMAIERLPEQQLTKAQTASQTMVSDLQSLNTLITSMGTAAKAFVPDSITNQSAWTSTTATSSNSTLASALTGVGALPGAVEDVGPVVPGQVGGDHRQEDDEQPRRDPRQGRRRRPAGASAD